MQSKPKLIMRNNIQNSRNRAPILNSIRKTNVKRNIEKELSRIEVAIKNRKLNSIMDIRSRSSSCGFGSSTQNSVSRIMKTPIKNMKLHLRLPFMNFTSATRRVTSLMKLKKDVKEEPIGCDKCTLHKLKKEFQCDTYKVPIRPPLPKPQRIQELKLKDIIKKNINIRKTQKIINEEECVKLSEMNSQINEEDTETYVKQSTENNKKMNDLFIILN